MCSGNATKLKKIQYILWNSISARGEIAFLFRTVLLHVMRDQL